MNISKNEFNAYVEGTLSTEQKVSIDTYLKDNPAEQRALQGAIEYEAKNDFSELLDALNQKLSPIIEPDIYSQPETESKRSRIFQLRKVLMPLLAVAATGLIFFFSVVNSKTSYKNYLDSYPDVVTASIRGELPLDELTILERGMIAYNNGDMQIANYRYDEHLLSEPTDTKARFYRAITELHLNNPEASLRELEIISISGEIMQFEDGVEWYKALNFMALERYSEAMPLLKKISESRHYKRTEATKLLSSID